MTVYVINHAEPTKPGFNLLAGGFDGPGGATPNSSLRLYGQGALSWGEGFDENVLRLAENFAGATPPLYPIEGQLWYSVKLYWHNTVGNTWWRWNYATSVWDNITANVFGPATPGSPNVGDYWFDGTYLKRWDSAYQQVVVGWMLRYFSSSTVSPTISDVPVHQVLAWTGTAWDLVSGVTAQASSPSSPTVGQLWYNTSNNTLNVWNGSSWVGVGGGAQMDMGGFKIINLGNATAATDALNMQTADARYVNVTGDTMTGFLTLNANPTSNLHAATKQYVVAKSGDTMTGLLILSGDPVAALGAVTKQYADGIGTTASGKVSKSGDTMTGLLILSGDPVAALGAVTKQYADNTAPWQGAHKFVSTGAPSGGVDGDIWFRYV
jgi:hypothetical protein